MKLKKSQFLFTFTGYGHYKVEYTTANERLKYIATITDMTIIDEVKNEEYPKQKDLKYLAQLVRRKSKTL